MDTTLLRKTDSQVFTISEDVEEGNLDQASNEQKNLTILATGLQQGVDHIDSTQVAKFVQFSEKLFEELLFDIDRTRITLIHDDLFITIEQLGGSINISIGDEKYTLCNTSLDQLLQKIASDIFAHPRVYSKEIRNNFISKALQIPPNNGDELSLLTQFVANFVCKNIGSLDDQIKFATAKLMYKHANLFENSQLSGISQSILLGIKLQHQLSLQSIAKHVIVNEGNFGEEHVWSGVIYSLFETSTNSPSFKCAASYLVKHRDNCPKTIATEAAWRFVTDNTTFFASAVKDSEAFRQFFRHNRKESVLKKYVELMRNALDSDANLYGTNYLAQCLSICSLWMLGYRDLVLQLNRDSEIVAFTIMEHIDHRVFEVWNSKDATPNTPPLMPGGSSSPIQN